MGLMKVTPNSVSTIYFEFHTHIFILLLSSVEADFSLSFPLGRSVSAYMPHIINFKTKGERILQ